MKEKKILVVGSTKALCNKCSRNVYRRETWEKGHWEKGCHCACLDVEVYDILTDYWTSPTHPCTSNEEFGVVKDYSGYVYLFGGKYRPGQYWYGNSGAGNRADSLCWKYSDGKKPKWEKLDIQMKLPRIAPATFYHGNKIYFIGGKEGSGEKYTVMVNSQSYDLIKGTWQEEDIKLPASLEASGYAILM